MKKILKSSPPNVLTIFAHKYPKSEWDKGLNAFRDYNKSLLYKLLKQQIFDEQGGICAYCESEVKIPNKQRVEHINDKSNYNQSTTWVHNLHLDWNNLVGVCLGGSDIRNKENPPFRTPINLSCDAYKENHAKILNPLEIQASPSLFKLKGRTGELEANSVNCKLCIISNNPYDSTEEFVSETIVNLNLNCDRLNTARHTLMVFYNKRIKGKNREFKEQLANKWFSQKYPSYFTTRRILLGVHAENFLKQNNYNG